MASGHDIAMALRAAYWTLHREADALLLPHGITADQFVLVSIIADCDMLTQKELVRRASSDANTIRAMLVLLERSGLVSRRPHQTDRRSNCVSLTNLGRKTYALLWKKSGAFHQRLLDAVGRSKATTFLQQLRALENMPATWHGYVAEANTHRPSRRLQSKGSSLRSHVL